MGKTCKIHGLKNNQRMSTQELLQTIYTRIEEGYTDFEIFACGQHNIGGAVWAKEIKHSKKNNGRKYDLFFHVTNPGQRVGAMAMDGTKIVVEGSAPADIGWLNSGAEITVKGDAGDTAAHCAAGGKIYVGGKVGTRSGALMKHDPKFEPPQFWVLKNTGSFSFEFMGGGIAVVCGWDCDNVSSILGYRSCVGMVGGVVYVRGPVEHLADCVEIVNLDKYDKDFLLSGMNEFLTSIERQDILEQLTDFGMWKKIVPLSNKHKESKLTVKSFKETQWFEGGLFCDLVDDDGEVYTLAQPGKARLKRPKWHAEGCISCNLCVNNCPQKAISKKDNEYVSLDNACIGCGICSAVCPKKVWEMINI